jgi:protein TonB
MAELNLQSAAFPVLDDEVMLSIVVNIDGKAEDIRVVKSLGMGLDEKAIEAVQKWRFIPGKKSGVPVRVKAQIAVSFRLL